MEACIDVANYIISVKGFRRAEEYSEMFRILREEGVIGKSLANKLEDMARFRNLLVHRYGEIDDRRVLEIIRRNLKDIEDSKGRSRGLWEEKANKNLHLMFCFLR